MKNRAGRKPRSTYRVLPTEAATVLSDDQIRWFRALGYLMPIAGADGEGDGDGEGAGSEGEGSGEGGSGSGEAGGEGDEHEPEGSGNGSGSDDDDDDDDDRNGRDEVPLRRSEYERLKRIAREHERSQKQRQKEEQKLKEKQRREQGQYEELLKEKDDAIASVEAERDEARYQLDAFKRRVRVTEAAKRLGYKDPEDAFRFLSDEDSEDENSTERALKRLARSKPYLVVERRSTGAPVNGDGVTLTMDQIKNMSQEEINSRWDEVQKAMAAV